MGKVQGDKNKKMNCYHGGIKFSPWNATHMAMNKTN